MQTSEISYRVGAEAFTGYLADGSNGRRVAGILVAHEGGGMTEHPRERARMLARHGRLAFVMDTFGFPITSLDHGRATVAALKANPSVLSERARAGLDVLRAQPNVDPRRLAAIGFCFGGSTVLELAREGAELRCVVGFHCGLEPLRSRDSVNIKCPILVCLGANDPIVRADQRAAFMDEMNGAGVNWRMILYGGVGHSFTNREVDAFDLPGFAYDRVADTGSWCAMSDVFDETLDP